MLARSLTTTLLLAVAMTTLPAAAQSPSPCSTPKAREFDFWIGEWTVTTAAQAPAAQVPGTDGSQVPGAQVPGTQVAGTNSIRPILDGCVLQETWTGASGSAGSSFNFYDPQRGKWRQLWVWRNGTTIEAEGDYADGKMVLAGQTKAQDGSSLENRITWFDNPDGTVRQHWEVSRDGGKTWTTSFDGHYVRTGAERSKP